MPKDKLWFTHDLNARNDRKIASLVKDYKSSGYGIFWCAVEMMHEEGGTLEFDEITLDAIAKDLNETSDLVKEIIEKCISKYKLFSVSDNLMKSNRVEKNIQERIESKDKKSRAGKVSAEARRTQQVLNRCSTPVQHSATHVEQNPTHNIHNITNNTDSTVVNDFNKEDNVSTVVQTVEVREESEKKIETEEYVFEKTPNGKQMAMPLPQFKINTVIELFKISKNSDITNDQVLSFWRIFKSQNFDGVNFYENEGKVYNHFINWCKKPNVDVKKIDNGTTRTNNSHQPASKPIAENKSSRSLKSL